MNMTEIDIIERFQERVGIRQFCGQLDEPTAVIQTWIDMRRVYDGPVPAAIERMVEQAKCSLTKQS